MNWIYLYFGNKHPARWPLLGLKPNGIFLELSKLKEFADNNIKFDENCRKFSKWLENTAGKGEIGCYEVFLLFPQCFQETCTADM